MTLPSQNELMERTYLPQDLYILIEMLSIFGKSIYNYTPHDFVQTTVSKEIKKYIPIAIKNAIRRINNNTFNDNFIETTYNYISKYMPGYKNADYTINILIELSDDE